MSSAITALNVADPIDISAIVSRETVVSALAKVRDGVITGEGPTTRGRVHFSRALDAFDAAWCVRILTASAVDHQPVSRAEAEALFEINDAAAERSDDGRFDDLLAKAVVHHAASASGLPVPSRSVALSAETAINSWAPARAANVNTEALEWIAGQMRGSRRGNRTLMALIATVIGTPLMMDRDAPAQLYVFDELGLLYRSTDGGDNWLATGYAVPSGLIPTRLTDLGLATRCGDQ